VTKFWPSKPFGLDIAAFDISIRPQQRRIYTCCLGERGSLNEDANMQRKEGAEQAKRSWVFSRDGNLEKGHRLHRILSEPSGTKNWSESHQHART